MKYILTALVFVAITSCTFGQFWTLSTPAFAPKTSCGQAAQSCYNKYTTAINGNISSHNFPLACQVLRAAFDCMESIVSGCTLGGAGDLEKRAVREGALEDQGGICGSDGTVQACGTDILACINEANNILTLLKSTNATAACPVLSQFDICSANVLSSNECRPKMVSAINQMRTTFAEDTLTAGCDGACAKSIGLCMATSAQFTTQMILTGSMKTYCQDIYTAIGCITGLQAKPQCQGDAAGLQLVSNTVQSQVGAITDLCTKDGSPSQCVQSLTQCIADLKDVLKTATVAQQCAATAAYLECLYLIPCINTLRPVVDQTTKSFETLEMEMNCPSVGNCGDRINVCHNQMQALLAVNANDEVNEYCSRVKQSYTCYDVVRKDPLCSREQASVSDFEQQVRTDVVGICGGGAVIKMSVFVLLISVVASLKRYI